MTQTSQLLAGAAACPISPDLGAHSVYLAGFGRNRVATEVHRDLMVRALALRLGDETFVLAVCDLVGLGHPDVLGIRKLAGDRGLDPDNLVVACTHTHSGPDTLGLWGPDAQTSGRDEMYVTRLRETIAEAALAAVDDLQPATLYAGRGALEGWIRNARDPEIIDRDLLVLRAASPDDAPIFTLMNLACHPEVLWNDSTLLSPDYAGVACSALDADGGTAILAVGALGGMLTPDVPDHSVASVEAMGEAVAGRARELLQDAQSLAVDELSFVRREVPLPLETPLLQAALEAGLLSRPDSGTGERISEVGLATLGAVRMASAPGELLPRVGFQVKALLDCPYPFLIGLADDEIGYVLPQEEFQLPEDPFEPGEHYEETMSLGPETAPRLLAAWQALLGRTS